MCMYVLLYVEISKLRWFIAHNEWVFVSKWSVNEWVVAPLARNDLIVDEVVL